MHVTIKIEGQLKKRVQTLSTVSFQILEPGLTTRKGRIMFELYLPLGNTKERYKIQGGGDRFSVHFAVTFLDG